MNTGEIILTTLITYQNQYRVFHWQTKSYSQHKAFGMAYEELNEEIDDFLESYQGKYGRVVATSTFEVSLDNYSEKFPETNEEFISFLVSELPSYLDKADTDLLNIRDEILGKINQLKYLLTLG
jgi:DNA-binding ferritin-like protein